jgi:hypothetical protein
MSMFFGTACGVIMFVVAFVKTFPAAWADSMGHCLIYLSYMSMAIVK